MINFTSLLENFYFPIYLRVIGSRDIVGDMILLKESFHNSIIKVYPSVIYHCSRYSKLDKDMSFDETYNSSNIVSSCNLGFHPFRDVVNRKYNVRVGERGWE